jgi:sulfate transport system ATP-binding protein
MSIEVRNIRKSFGSFEVLRDVSLMVETGSLVALLGPSGSGKTTLLRVIAGLEQCDEGGMILFHDEDVAERHVRERQVGFVFQHYALFRHMTVFENIAFGLRVRPRNVRPSKKDISDKVHELLTLVQLDGFAHRYPNQLSGGQRQRVALHVRSPSSRKYCCSTSRSARWTRKCARSFASGCAGCTTSCTSRACSSPTTRKKRSRWRTGS